MDGDEYLIIKRGLYYRPGGKGYTGVKSEAGRFSKKEAESSLPECDYLLAAIAPDYSVGCWPETRHADIVGKMESKNEALRAENERLRQAASNAASVFEWYANLHRAKGPEHQHKTERNEREGILLREVLREQAIGSNDQTKGAQTDD